MLRSWFRLLWAGWEVDLDCSELLKLSFQEERLEEMVFEYWWDCAQIKKNIAIEVKKWLYCVTVV